MLQTPQGRAQLGHVLVIAFVLLLGWWQRTAFVLHIHPPENTASYSDMAEYASKAGNIAQGRGPAGGFAPSFKPIGYYWLLALSFLMPRWHVLAGPFALITWINLLGSFLIPIFLWRGCRRWLGQHTAAIVLIVAMFDFSLLGYAGFLLAELPFALLLAAMVSCLLVFRFPWKPPEAALLGAIWGVSVLIKGQSLLFAPFGILATIPLLRSVGTQLRSWRAITVSWSVFLAVGLALLFGQSAYLSYHAGQFVPLPTVSGVNFLASKMPECRMIYTADGSWVCSPMHHQLDGCTTEKACWINSPLDNGPLFFRTAIEAIVRQPVRLFEGMRNFLFLFAGNEAFPIRDEADFRQLNRFSEFFFALFLLPGLWVALIKGLAKRMPTRVRMLIALAWTGLFPYLFLSEAEIRYRIPFDVVLFPLAIWGWSSVIRRLREVRYLLPKNIFTCFWILLLAPWMTYTLYSVMRNRGPLSPSTLVPLVLALTAIALRLGILVAELMDREFRAFWRKAPPAETRGRRRLPATGKRISSRALRRVG
jgi:hypothetical protein